MWLAILLVIWIGVDVLVIATCWYLISTIKPYFPNWWKQNMVIEVDRYFETESGLGEAEPELEEKEPSLVPLHTPQR